jgi:Tfp pilus assembly protein PilF
MAHRVSQLTALIFFGCGLLVAADVKPAIELRCKLVAARGERGYKLWKVELKNSSGEPVRQAVAGGGDTVPFKGLPPGIYVLCISGEKGRSRCESIDLVPAPGQSAARFHKTIETPLSRDGDSNRVDARRLAVPGGARREMLRAEEAQLRGESKSAVEHLERAIAIYPKYADALNNLGTHYHRKGDYARSIDYFTKVTEIDPRFFAGWVNLGGSLLAAGKVRDALSANLKAVELRPNDPLANTQLGVTYFYLHQYVDAKAYFRKVIEIDPASANSPQLFLAHIAMAERSVQEAEQYIRSYLDIHPHSPRAPHLRRTLESLATGGLVSPQR